jgi:hypothetical protein
MRRAPKVPRAASPDQPCAKGRIASTENRTRRRHTDADAGLDLNEMQSLAPDRWVSTGALGIMLSAAISPFRVLRPVQRKAVKHKPFAESRATDRTCRDRATI